jgi:hypothetical protein
VSGRRGRGQEHQTELTHLDLVTVGQHRRADQFTVDIGAVEAVDVDHLEFSVLPPKLGVALADGDVVEDDVAVGMPAGGCDGPILQEPGPGVGAALHDKQGRASRQPFDSPVFVAHVLFLIGWSWPPTHRGRCLAPSASPRHMVGE